LAVMLTVVVLPFLHLNSAGAGLGTAHGFHIDERFSVALIAVWAVLSLVRAVELVRSALHLRGIAASAREVEVGPQLAALLGESGQPVALCVSDVVDRPSVVGFLRPRILLPGSLLETLSASELEQIVLHEMEHLRRRDDWTNLLQKLSLVLFPLNPVLVWIERRLCLERELACDDQVLRATQARKAYAACLANLAEHAMVRRGVSLALGAWERQSELVRRVHRILARPNHEMGRRQAGLAAGVMIVALFAGADGLAHSPRLVSFGPAAAAVNMAAVEPMSQSRYMGRSNGATAQDVVFHPPVVKARARFVVKARPRVRMAAVSPAPQMYREVRQVSMPADATGGVVVLVTWRAVTPISGSAPAVAQSSQFSYAAVPTRNGWLFVQL
jgi:hypothetical protein